MKRRTGIPDYAWDEAGVRRYARESARYDTQYRTFLMRLDAVRPGTRILDVGAGPGPLTARIAERFPDADIVALEISPLMAEAGAALIEERGLSDRVQYVTGDAADPALAGRIGPFDLICSSYSLHEWKDPLAAVLQLRRMLTRDGVLLLHDLRRVPWLAWIPFPLPMLQSMRASYTVEEITAILSDIPGSQLHVTADAPFMLTVTLRPLDDGR
ncbi:class I SAM-dependent methyltransferase [bacterium]|nr:class I SAM-dependent methyltransferase [bacterium]